MIFSFWIYKCFLRRFSDVCKGGEAQAVYILCSHSGSAFSLRLKSEKGILSYIARGILSPNLIRNCPAVNA